MPKQIKPKLKSTEFPLMNQIGEYLWLYLGGWERIEYPPWLQKYFDRNFLYLKTIPISQLVEQ